MFQTRFFITLTVLAGFASAAFAESAKETFEKLFGEEVKRVNATPEANDDVELAGQLLGAARNSDNAEMRDLLCEYTYALAGRDPSGYATAAEAMRLVAEKNPEQKSSAESKIVQLYQRGYERSTGDKKQAAGEQYLAFLLQETESKLAVKDYGEAVNHLRRARPVSIAIRSPEKDAVQAKLDYYAPLAIISNRIELAEKKVAANPWDKPSRATLVETYLTDMDSPAKAKEHLDLGGDAVQKKMVPLAVKPADELSEADAMALASFYEDLGKKGVAPTRIAMLQRSKGYYELYLTLHSSEDVQRTAATLNQTRVDEALAKLEAEAGLTGGKSAATASADGKTIELLDFIDPSRDGRRGKWLRSGDTIIVEQGNGFEIPLLRVPVKIEGGYSLKVKFVRESGDGAFGVLLPVGDSQVAFTLALPPGGEAGLSDINGQPATQNATKKESSLNNGKVYTLDINVKPETDGTAAITVALDGKSYVDWKGKQAELSVGVLITMNDKTAIGFSSYNSAVIIGSAKIKPLAGGKAETLEKAVDAAAKKATKDVKPTNRDDDRRDREKAIQDFLKDRFKQ
ncbi:MAG: hypothetical protein WD768_15170 [Phycisphaeraceae bacterium]